MLTLFFWPMPARGRINAGSVWQDGVRPHLKQIIAQSNNLGFFVREYNQSTTSTSTK
jgi:hypothetical protein